MTPRGLLILLCLLPRWLWAQPLPASPGNPPSASDPRGGARSPGPLDPVPQPAPSHASGSPGTSSPPGASRSPGPSGLLGASSPPRTKPAPGRWLQEHLLVDAAATVGWRAGQADEQHSGFSVLAGGGEVNLGLEITSGYAVLAGARVLSGTSSTQSLDSGGLSYLEATGHIGAQVPLTDWVRLGLGASAGRVWRCCAPAPSTTSSGTGPAPQAIGPDALSLAVGGFLRLGVDWLPRDAALLRAFSIWLRIDVDGHPIDETATLPAVSLGLSLSIGLRL